MTHELKRIVRAYETALTKGKQVVLATVVHVEGSSYRRPGVQMLIDEDGHMTGAVSGGCVEKEVNRQAQEVFETGVPRVMTYDGRYRLGCEGILYILIEPFAPDKGWTNAFWEAIKTRAELYFSSQYRLEEGADQRYGSTMSFPNGEKGLRPGFQKDTGLQNFSTRFKPCFKLIIVGAEHDAVKLCGFAAMMGWEVTVVTVPTEQKTIEDFPGAHDFLTVPPETFQAKGIDTETAILLMTHSFAKDLAYLLALKKSQPAYLGLLGPANRREKLMDALIEKYPEVSETFLENIYGPAGLNLGSETPEEIAISVLSEILAIVRNKTPMGLRDKKGTIHS